MSVKAFELVPVVERELLTGGGGGVNVTVECLECCGKHLYAGTSDGLIHHFLLEETADARGRPVYLAQKLQQRHLGTKRGAVAELRAASALERLIVLSTGDASIYLHDMMSLEPVPPPPSGTSGGGGAAKIKGVLSFCVNENPVGADPFCVELGVICARRRAVQIYTLQEDRVQLVKELTTPQQPCAICLDGYFLCLALASQYVILNYSTGASQDLFPFDSEERKPIVKRIGREEFLLAAPGGLGMFANAEGISQRAPVNWSEHVIGAAVCFPYVVALDEGFVTVHSMLDQQLKQTLSFRDGHILQDFEGKLVLASTKAAYMLVPLPLERQIQDLLAGNRVEEALTLTEGARRNIPKDRFQILHKRILQQAGFIHFGQLQFLEAKEHFRKGQLDVRELISLYPLLLPATSSFTRCHPPLHPFADLNQLTQGDQDKALRCKRFLISYLHEVRSCEAGSCDGEGGANGFREEVDTALLKLYAEADHESLLDLLASDNACLLADSAPWLEKHHKYFALGLLYHYNGQDASAVQMWVKVVDGVLQDSTRSDLFEYVVDFLSFCPNLDLVWKHAEWALNKDQEVGVQIFTKRPVGGAQGSSNLSISTSNSIGRLNPEDVVTYLQKHSRALLLYLEHLVLEQQVQKERFHTHLAVLYVERVLGLLSQPAGPEDEALRQARSKLQRLLKESSLYRVQLIMGKVEGLETLLEERAILHGRLGEHDRALHILVHQLRDRRAAEVYCTWATNEPSTCTTDSIHQDPASSSSSSPRLFHLLLATYLDPEVPGGVDNMAAVDLLNRHGHMFDAAHVLDVVPEAWSLQLLRPFLTTAVRKSAHDQRTAQLALGLARSENLQLLHDRLKFRGGPVLVSDKKGCHLCHNTFSEPDCVCLPGGRPVHTHCATQCLLPPQPQKQQQHQQSRDSPTRRRLENGSNPT